MRKIFKRGQTRLTGIYFLFSKNKLVYIGKTVNLYLRLDQHKFDWDTVRLIPCDESKLDYYEKKFIMRYRPSLNKRHLVKVDSKKWNDSDYTCTFINVNMDKYKFKERVLNFQSELV